MEDTLKRLTHIRTKRMDTALKYLTLEGIHEVCIYFRGGWASLENISHKATVVERDRVRYVVRTEGLNLNIDGMMSIHFNDVEEFEFFPNKNSKGHYLIFWMKDRY